MACGRSDVRCIILHLTSYILRQERRLKNGPTHRETLTAMNNLGAVLRQQGDLTGAVKLYRETLARRRELLGNQHPDTLTSVNNLGLALLEAGKGKALKEAGPLLVEAFGGVSDALGYEHEHTAIFRTNLLALREVRKTVREKTAERIAAKR